MNKLATITRKFFLAAAVLSASLISTAPAITMADCSSSTANAIQCGTNAASNTTQTPADATTSINGTIKTFINILSVAVGITAVVMIMLAGFRYVTSGGKQESIASAKNSLLYAIVGLVIVALAQIIVHFVLTNTVNPCVDHKTPSGQKC